MKMRNVEVDWLKTLPSLTQAYNSGIEFAFVNDKLQMVTAPAFCKDYLQDAIYAQVTDHPMTIYGFTHSSKAERQVSYDKTRMLFMDAGNANFESKLDNVYDLISQLERKLGFSKSRVYRVTNPPKKYAGKCFMFVSSNQWMIAPPMLSMYTLTLRVGGSHTVGQSYEKTFADIAAAKITTPRRGDESMIKNGLKGINLILEHGVRTIFHPKLYNNYYLDRRHYTAMHSSTGIVAYSMGNSKTYFPHWYKVFK